MPCSDEKVQLPVIHIGGSGFLQTETEGKPGISMRSSEIRVPCQPLFVFLKCVVCGLRQGWPIGINAPVQQCTRNLLVKFSRKGRPGNNSAQETLREMAHQGLFIKQCRAIGVIQSRRTHSWHSRYVALDICFIGI